MMSKTRTGVWRHTQPKTRRARMCMATNAKKTQQAAAVEVVLRFHDSFKSYYDRHFCDSRGRAFYVLSVGQVWLPHPDTIPWVHVPKPFG